MSLKSALEGKDSLISKLKENFKNDSFNLRKKALKEEVAYANFRRKADKKNSDVEAVAALKTKSLSEALAKNKSLEAGRN